MKKVKDRFERKITKEESTAFRKHFACKSACKKLVEEIVNHWESAAVAECALWDGFYRKYKVPNDYSIEIDHVKRMLIAKKISEADKYLRGLRRNDEIEDKVAEAFRSKRKAA